MIYYISYLKDSIGNNYLGINFDHQTVIPYLEKLKDFLPEEYETYVVNQQKRDSGSHHCTVINVMEYNGLCKSMGISKFVSSLDEIFKFPIDDFKMMGIGSASRGGNTTYFIVCKSEKLEEIRKRYNLSPHDFHITLGFKWKDVFGVRKNEVLSTTPKFIQLLKSEFYKKENFDFVKRIKNYDEDDRSEIIPISITNNHLKIYCDGYIMDVGMIEEENILYIMAKYKSSDKPVRMPLTEIIKKFE